MRKVIQLLTVILISLLLVLNTSGCDGEIIKPLETPLPVPASVAERANVPDLSYVIVDTGQDKCYDNSKEISCPTQGKPFSGQDAQYQGNRPAYSDNGDGTVTDLNTRLMWQKTPGSKITYIQAVAGAKNFSLAGYKDWRLPTIKELYSLIIFSGTDPSGPENSRQPVPFLDTSYFDFEYGDTRAGERVIDAQYWSSTEYISTTMNGAATVFGVNFADGRIKGYPRDIGQRGQPTRQFVRYVRANSNYGVNNFVNNGDGTITDRATGLMWAQSDSGEGMNWEAALAWVQQKNRQNYLGYNDWRLPNAKELQSIVDYTRAPDITNSAAIAPLFIISSITNKSGRTDYPFFWTSTTHVGMADNIGGRAAVYIAFGRAMGYMQMSQGGGQQLTDFGPPPIGGQQQSQSSGIYQYIDVHGAGAQRSDPKEGNPSDYPQGRGPQGDEIRIYNYIRCVKNAQ